MNVNLTVVFFYIIDVLLIEKAIFVESLDSFVKDFTINNTKLIGAVWAILIAHKFLNLHEQNVNRLNIVFQNNSFGLTSTWWLYIYRKL